MPVGFCISPRKECREGANVFPWDREELPVAGVSAKAS